MDYGIKQLQEYIEQITETSKKLDALSGFLGGKNVGNPNINAEFTKLVDDHRDNLEQSRDALVRSALQIMLALSRNKPQ